jgi:serine/threonine-protein kinase RsbW
MKRVSEAGEQMQTGGTNPRPGRSTAPRPKARAASGKRRAKASVSSESAPIDAPFDCGQINGRVDLRFSTTIPSLHPASQEVQKRILDAVAKIGFTPHSSFAIKLALEEEMINAIKHGNKEDPKKNVHIQAKVTPKCAEIIIEDEGAGFSRAAVPDPTLEENREKCSGRGILLIESYMNTVKWSHNGRRLRMIKRNGEEPGVR